jgi:WD40 repeat protein
MAPQQPVHSHRQQQLCFAVLLLTYRQITLLWLPAGHQSDVDTVAWHPNSQYIATGSSNHGALCFTCHTAKSHCHVCLQATSLMWTLWHGTPTAST